MNVIFKNLLKAIGVMGYFMVLNLAYARMNTDRLMNDIEVFSGIFLVLGLILLEIAYKKDDGKLALGGIELLCLSIHSLSINHIITFYQYDFRFYLLTSSYIFAIYYVLKSIIIYTKEKRDYLRTLSDISEIVKEEPIKKEAKKRRKVASNKKTDGKKENKEVESKIQKKTNTKKSQESKKSKKENNSKEETKKRRTTKKQDKVKEEEKEKKQENKELSKKINKKKKKEEVKDND